VKDCPLINGLTINFILSLKNITYFDLEEKSYGEETASKR
jgi:hypothetical protein